LNFYGANVGLMGAVADGVLNGGGENWRYSRFLRSKEIAHNGLTELIVVDSMHERKTKMNDLCDGVITLPGALELLKSFLKCLLGLNLDFTKPIAVLNSNGFYDA
jgi:uncharacterized protein (TIGR00730 family)